MASGTLDGMILIVDVTTRIITHTLVCMETGECVCLEVWRGLDYHQDHQHYQEVWKGLEEQSNTVNAIAWSPCGERIALGTEGRVSHHSGHLEVVVVKVGSVEVEHMIDFAGVWHVMWSPSGEKIAASNLEGMCIVDALTGNIDLNLTSVRYGLPFQLYCPATPIAWSPCGLKIATADDACMHVLNARTEPMEQHIWWEVDCRFYRLSRTGIISWHPRGRKIAAGDMGGDVYIVDAHSGEYLLDCSFHTWHVHRCWVTVLCWSPCGANLAVASGKRLKIWDGQSGRTQHTVHFEEPVGHFSWSP